MESDEHMSYIREFDHELLISLNNFSENIVTVSIPESVSAHSMSVILSNMSRETVSGASITLEPWECLTMTGKK